MASGVLRSCFSQVIEEKNVVEGSERCMKMIEDVKKLIDIGGDSHKMHIFDTFSEKHSATIETSFYISGKEHSSVQAWREKAQINFHRLQLSEIPAMWTLFYSQMGLKREDPLLLQSVSQEVFNTLLLHRMGSRICSSY